MPELPEVETVRRGLAAALAGRRILRAVQNRPDLRWPLPERFAERLTGRRIGGLGRRGKYLLLGLEDPGGETLIAHLGMSGRFLLRGETGGAQPGAAFHHSVAAESGGGRKHDHVVLHMEGGLEAAFNDARRFGAMDLCPTEALDAHRLLAALGPEPLSNAFSAARLADSFAGRATSLKAALLDQRRVAGLGNIYVCEALHRAGLSPFREAGALSEAETTALWAAIRAVLEEAIAAGGSSLRDFHGASGELGYFQHGFAVYDREGAPCGRCGAPVRRAVQTGRSTFHCAGCQV